MWQSHLISHSLPVPVSRSLQVSLLASQPTKSAARGETCGEPAVSHDSHHVSLVQWTNLFASRHKGHRFKSTGGYLCGTGILLLALSRYNLLIFFGLVHCISPKSSCWLAKCWNRRHVAFVEKHQKTGPVPFRSTRVGLTKNRLKIIF